MINLAAELREAGFSPEALEALAERAAERAIRKVLAERAEQLEPLAAILGCTAKAATMRLGRDPALRLLGVRVGKRWLFKRSTVERYYGNAAR